MMFCRHVPTGDAADEPGRVGGGLPAARAQRAAHGHRHPDTGTPVARVIHSFGRADTVDRDALARLVASISRFLTPEQAVAAAQGVQVEDLDSRRMGGAWTLD